MSEDDTTETPTAPIPTTPIPTAPSTARTWNRLPAGKRAWAGAAAALIAVSGVTGFGIGRGTAVGDVAPASATVDPSAGQGAPGPGGPGGRGAPPELPQELPQDNGDQAPAAPEDSSAT